MRPFILCLCLLSPASLVLADDPPADWPQFLGPERDGRYLGPALAESWPSEGPRVLWTHTAGAGFSGPVVHGERVIFFHRLDDRDAVEALDAASGKVLWRFDYPAAYKDRFGFNSGPRASPTVAGDRVFTYSADGRLHALDLATGGLVWSVETHRKFGADTGFFGAGVSPLVDDGRVIVGVGGKDDAGIVAFDAAKGDVLWQTTRDEASYASPIATTITGTRRLLVWTREALVSLDPVSGTAGPRFRWRSRQGSSVNAATPLVVGERVFLSASYNTGAALLTLTDGTWKPLWTSDEVLSNHYSTSVHAEGYLYGFHGRIEAQPELRCIRLEDGEVIWSEERFGGGSIILAGEDLVILRENGELVVAPASSEGFAIRNRAKVLEPTVRAAPALAHGRLYARDEAKLVAVDLRPATSH